MKLTKSKPEPGKPLSGAVQLNAIRADIEDLEAKISDLNSRLAEKNTEIEATDETSKKEKVKADSMKAKYADGAISDDELNKQLDLVQDLKNKRENLQQAADAVEGRRDDLDIARDRQIEQRYYVEQAFYRQVRDELKKKLVSNSEVMDLLIGIELSSLHSNSASILSKEILRELGPGGLIQPEDKKRIYADLHEQYLKGA